MFRSRKPVPSGETLKERASCNLANDVSATDGVSCKVVLQDKDHGGSDDDDIFFELSESSGSSGIASTSISTQFSSKNTDALEPRCGADNRECFNAHMPDDPEDLAGETGSGRYPERLGVPEGAHEADSGGSGKRSSRRNSTIGVHVSSDETSSREPPSNPAVVSFAFRGTPREAGTSKQSPAAESAVDLSWRGGQKNRLVSNYQADPSSGNICTSVAVDTAEDVVHDSSRSLDLGLAMLPLIPSYPLGSAEIFVRVHDMVIIPNADPPTTPPYVRVSLHPGVQVIARTGPPVIGRTFNAAPFATNDGGYIDCQDEDFILEANAPPEKFVEYLFGQTNGTGTTNKHVVSLPLKPQAFDTMAERNHGASPPTIRLDIVSGRSFGWVELALSEVLRNPGKVFQKLTLPVRKRERSLPHGNRCTESGCLAGRRGRTAGGDEGYRECRIIAVGHIRLDLGVIFAGSPLDSPPDEKSGAVEEATGVVAVEALDVRLQSSERGRLGLDRVERASLIGVSASLTLGGDMKIATFVEGERGQTEPGEIIPGCAPVKGELPYPDGRIELRSTCVMLDVLVLNLVQDRRPDIISSRCAPGRGKTSKGQRKEGLGGYTVKIAVSDINDIFGGQSRWVKMQSDCLEEENNGRGGGLTAKHAVSGLETDGGTRSIEVRLRLSLGDEASPRLGENRNIVVGGGSTAAGRSYGLRDNFVIESRIQQHQRGVAETAGHLSIGSAPRATPHRWIMPSGRDFTYAHVNFSSLGNLERKTAMPNPRGNRWAPASQARPGLLELDVLAIHGRRQDICTEANSSEEGVDFQTHQPSTTSSSHLWWVRVIRPNEGERGGAARSVSGVSVAHSPPGSMFPIEGVGLGRDGDLATAALRAPPQKGKNESCSCNWLVCWPGGDGLSTKCRIHWTLNQSVVPTIFFQVYCGQALDAICELELPSIILHAERPRTFFHPCRRVGIPGNRRAEALHRSKMDSSSDASIFLKLRCSFQPSSSSDGGGHCEQRLRLYDTPVAPEASLALSRVQQGGILFVQVVATQRLHREVRSALNLPCSVVFSVPQHGPMSASSNNGFGLCDPTLHDCDNARVGTEEQSCAEGCCENGRCQLWQGGGEGGVVALQIEPRTHGCVMIFVALLAGRRRETRGGVSHSESERDGHGPSRNKSVLGSTWIAVSEDVMERGHLREGWYPLRVANSDWSDASKTCDIRLRMHFMPGLQHPTVRLSQSASGPQGRKTENTQGRSLTIVLEEGRDITHPELLMGPFELFAEVTVDFQLEQGRRYHSHCPVGEAGHQRTRTYVPGQHSSFRVVGPLPMREGLSSCDEPYSFSTAVALGKGASPCWQHVMRVPLPGEFASASDMKGPNEIDQVPDTDPSPEVTGGRSREAPPLNALLSVTIKSAARREATRCSSPAPRSLLASVTTGVVQPPEERTTERCLLVGIARIRLPSHVLRESSSPPIRGWYTVKDEANVADRGKVRLSIFPTGNSTSLPRHHRAGSAGAMGGRKGCEGGTTLGFCERRRSSSPQRQSDSARLAAPRSAPTPQTSADVDSTDRYSNGISEDSDETDGAVKTFSRCRGGSGVETLQGCGLLFVSVGELEMYSSGESAHRPHDGETGGMMDRTGAAGSPPRIAGAAFSLRREHNRDLRHHGQQRTHSSKRGGIHGRSEQEDCVYVKGSLNKGDGSFGAVIALDRYRSPDDSPVLDVRVQVQKPRQPIRTTYRGAVSIASCLSTAGLAVQETKGLMEETQKRSGRTTPTGHKKMNTRCSSLPRNRDHGGSDDGSSSNEDGAWSRAYTNKTRRCCAVNITTTFVPHVKGLLKLLPAKLCLEPPSTVDLERWRSLAEVRERADLEATGATSPTNMPRDPTVVAPTGTASVTRTSAFLRVRLLPSGPWEFSRTFPLTIPRLMDWSRNPRSAGRIDFPGGTRFALEVDSAIQAIARRRLSESLTYTPRGSPPAVHVSPCHDCEASVEPLALEVCLFENNRRSSSSSSSLCLLGCGTMLLAPVIIAGICAGHPCRSNPINMDQDKAGQPFGRTPHILLREEVTYTGRQDESSSHAVDEEGEPSSIGCGMGSSISCREVALFDPCSTKRIGSISLGVAFSLHDSNGRCERVLYPSESPRRAESLNHLGGAVPKIHDVGKAVWALKALFYGLDPDNAGFVRVNKILDALAQAEWPHESSASVEQPASEKVNKGDIATGSTAGGGAGGGRDSRRLLDLLTALGVGMTYSLGTANNHVYQEGIDENTNGNGTGDKAQGVHLVRYILHLLHPRGVAGDDQLVSWEVWAALSEEVVCNSHTFERRNGRAAPAVNSISVWRRAKGFRCADSAEEVEQPSSTVVPTHGLSITTGGKTRRERHHASGYSLEPRVDDSNSRVNTLGQSVESGKDCSTVGERFSRRGSKRHGCTSSFSTGATEELFQADNGVRGSGRAGYGDISSSINESPQTHGSSPERDVSTPSGGSNRIEGPRHTPQARIGAAHRKHPHQVGSDSSIRRRRLHHSLTESRRRWCCSKTSDAQISTALGVERFDSTLCQRPATAPAAPGAAGKDTKSQRTLSSPPRSTWSAPEGPQLSLYHLANDLEVPRDAGGGLGLGRSNNTACAEEPTIGAWVAGVVIGGSTDSADCGGQGTRHDMTARQDLVHELETRRFRTETASARRKAWQYQTGMREAQCALDKEQQRALALESRALQSVGLLLQRDRVRIREVARARSRLLVLEVERTRRKERVASKKQRVKAQSTAATRVQRIAKGYLQRRSFEAELRNIRALQRGVRSMLEARRRYQYRLRRSLMALLLQRIWRGRLARKCLAGRAARATIIQALVRGHLQRARISEELGVHLRRRLDAATVIQTYRRYFVSRQAYLLLQSTCVNVQSIYRRRRARRELINRRLAVRVLQRAARYKLLNLFRKQAAMVIQKAYRSALRTKRCRHERQNIMEAAGHIEQAVRSWVARRIVRRKREIRRRYRAVMALQCVIRRHLRKRSEHRRRVAAAVTLWKFMGGLSAALYRARKRRRLSCAVKVQRAFRQHRSHVRARVLRDERRAYLSATRIQAVVRGNNSRAMTDALLCDRRREIEADTTKPAAQRESRRRCDEMMPDLNLTRKTKQQHRHSWPTTPSSRPGKDVDSTQLQLVVEALANGLSRRDVFSQADARHLKATIALREDDPELEIALRKRLLSIEAALSSSAGRENESSTTFQPVVSSVEETARVENALGHSLRALERSLRESSV